jgi:hypothetical protein
MSSEDFVQSTQTGCTVSVNLNTFFDTIIAIFPKECWNILLYSTGMKISSTLNKNPKANFLNLFNVIQPERTALDGHPEDRNN